MFKKLIYLLIVLFFLAGNAYASEYFRCGCHLIEIGDPKYQVIKQCGKPVSKDITGYTQKGYGMKIEELIYGPRSGIYYYLKFIGNRLVKIESIRH